MATRKSNAGANTPVTGQSAQAKTQRDREKPKAAGKENAAEPKIVTFTFNLTVPKSTARVRKSVFLTGTFHQLNKNVVDWEPKAHQMKPVDDTHWTVSLGGPEGTMIEYKYTLGDWEHVEQDEHCGDTPNRRVTMRAKADKPLNISDTVQNWRNVQP